MNNRPPNAERQLSQVDADRLAIGAVSYLNSKPLVEDLEELCPESSLIFDLPSRLADSLSNGALDIALIPSVEAFSDPDYEIVSDACVATHGPVLSVKLYSRVHPGMVKTLALDEGSRTSAALARILLADRFGVFPELQRLPIEKTTQDSDADAILLIGDRAISPPDEKFAAVWDLGEEWVNWTGLPFVFAMWVARRQTDLGEIPYRLSIARNRGLKAIERIAQEGAEKLNLSYDTSRNYLTQNLHFRIGPAEREGLKLFHRLASQLGLTQTETLNFQPTPSCEQLFAVGS